MKPEILHVTERKTVEIEAGAQLYDRFQIDKNGTLRLTGDTKVHTAKLILAEGAKIEFDPSDADDSLFDLSADDASEVVELTINARGQDGASAGSSPATTGEKGRNAGGGIGGRKSRAGGTGHSGGHGRHGGDAADVSLYLNGVPKGVRFYIDATGGNGGNGQKGGTGGKGGNGNTLRGCSRGGNGGRGGNAGNGGSAGDVLVSLVKGKATQSIPNASDWITVTIKDDPGQRGIQGLPGDPGQGGRKKHGRDCSKGASGGSGGDGQAGGKSSKSAGTVQFMTVEDYATQREATLAKLNAIG